MVGLGVFGNQPAGQYQPPIVEGIHLRWGFPGELGFPWHGFFLFRRLSRSGTPLCLSSVIGGLSMGNWPDKKYYTPLGLLSSNTNLVLTEDFAPADRVEFALSGRKNLRFDLPAGELASRLDLRIGFRPQRCLDFKTLLLPPAPPMPDDAPVIEAARLTASDVLSRDPDLLLPQHAALRMHLLAFAARAGEPS